MENIHPFVKYVINRQTDKDWKISTRMIEDHELVFITSGRGTITIGGRDYPVAENNIVYFYSGLKHALKTDNADCMSFYAAHFDLQDNAGRLPLPDISHLDANVRIKRLFYTLREVYIKKPYMGGWKQNIIFQDILYEIFTVSRRQIPPANVQRINRVINYIHANPYKKFNMAELTQMAGTKKTYFINIFKEITGQTPLKYTLNLKLEHSKNMLINSDETIKEIAESCGFNDEFYYSRMFKAAFGMPPKEFRNSL